MTVSTTLRPLGRVLITGGSSGLGAAIARAVSEAGGTPAIIDLTVEGAASGGVARSADVSDRAQVESAVASIVDELGGLDAVVTAAGIDRCGRLEDVAAEEWERVIGVNLLGTVSTVRAALPHIERVHGRVVTVASSLALRALPEATAYCASKFGVLGFSRALAAETAGRLGVTTLIPAGMQTAFFDDRPEQYRPSADAQLNDPANVARAVIFALQQPQGSEVRELVLTPEEEPSWP
ncbi:SDR family oxidoreductase [Leucobacter sp. USHLN153]|uniref:SDR family oxidoreductase n=1 Tax=Leucobacter sp. USHLN153 TaxID=3081268 RepID=UPI0030195B48